jgi:hypothetical protein
MSVMPDDPHYMATWRRYRLWRRLFLTAFWGYLPYFMIVAVCLRRLGIKSDGWTLGLVVPWFLFIPIARVVYVITPCPRCGKQFFKSFATTCRYCGLPRWAPCDPLT